MTIQKGNALLANRAGKSSAPLLAPSVSQGSALHQVLSRLQGVKRSGTGYVALCPAHNDRHPSLSIDELSDGRVLLHCWAGCDTESIVSAIGLTMSDLFPQSGRKPSRHRKTKAERQEEAQRQVELTLERRFNQVEDATNRDLLVLIRTVDRALTNGGWQAIFTNAPGTDDLAKLAHQLDYWNYLAGELIHGDLETKLAVLPHARRGVTQWQSLAKNYSSN